MNRLIKNIKKGNEKLLKRVTTKFSFWRPESRLEHYGRKSPVFGSRGTTSAGQTAVKVEVWWSWMRCQSAGRDHVWRGEGEGHTAAEEAREHVIPGQPGRESQERRVYCEDQRVSSWGSSVKLKRQFGQKSAVHHVPFTPSISWDVWPLRFYALQVLQG